MYYNGTWPDNLLISNQTLNIGKVEVAPPPCS